MIYIIYYDCHNDNDDDEDHVDSHKNSGGHSPFDPSARTGLHSIYTRHYTSPPLLLILGALFGSSLPVLTADRQNCDIMPPKRLFQTDNVSSRLFNGRLSPRQMSLNAPALAAPRRKINAKNPSRFLQKRRKIRKLAQNSSSQGSTAALAVLLLPDEFARKSAFRKSDNIFLRARQINFWAPPTHIHQKELEIPWKKCKASWKKRNTAPSESLRSSSGLIIYQPTAACSILLSEQVLKT